MCRGCKHACQCHAVNIEVAACTATSHITENKEQAWVAHFLLKDREFQLIDEWKGNESYHFTAIQHFIFSLDSYHERKYSTTLLHLFQKIYFSHHFPLWCQTQYFPPACLQSDTSYFVIEEMNAYYFTAMFWNKAVIWKQEFEELYQQGLHWNSSSTETELWSSCGHVTFTTLRVNLLLSGSSSMAKVVHFHVFHVVKLRRRCRHHTSRRPSLHAHSRLCRAASSRSANQPVKPVPLANRFNSVQQHSL